MSPQIETALAEGWTVRQVVERILRIDTPMRAEEEIRAGFERAIREKEAKHARILDLFVAHGAEGAGRILKEEELTYQRDLRQKANEARERLNAARALIAAWEPIPFMDEEGTMPNRYLLGHLEKEPNDRLLELHDEGIACITAKPPIAYFIQKRDETADIITQLHRDLEKAIEQHDEERDWRRRIAATMECLEVAL